MREWGKESERRGKINEGENGITTLMCNPIH